MVDVRCTGAALCRSTGLLQPSYVLMFLYHDENTYICVLHFDNWEGNIHCTFTITKLKLTFFYKKNHYKSVILYIHQFQKETIVFGTQKNK